MSLSVKFTLTEAKNGYVIYLEVLGGNSCYPDLFVAKDMPEVLEIIGKIYLKAKEKE